MLRKVVIFCKNSWHILVLALLLLASSYALFYPTLFRVHDFVHGARIAQMSLALKDGHFPVIWTRDFGFGYGMPLFQFYAPLPYYVGSFFYLLGFSLSLAVKSVFFIPSLLSLVGAYFLGRDLFQNKLSGVLLASLFVLAPYRALNLFVRGAVSESWGMAFYPFILWASWLVIQKKRFGFLALVLALLGLFLSHNLSVVMFLPFAVSWTGITWFFSVFVDRVPSRLPRELSLRSWWLTQITTPMLFLASYILAFGLAAFYLIPAFLEKGFTQMEKIIIGHYFDYHLHFIYLRQLFKDNWGYGGSGWGPNDGISFFLGLGPWLGLVSLVMSVFGLGLWLLFNRFKLKRRLKLSRLQWFSLFQVGVSLIFFVVAILLSTEKSLFIWEKIQFLKYLQFPWRYLSVAVMFLSLAVASLPALFSFSQRKSLKSSKKPSLSRYVGKLSWLIGFLVTALTLVTSWRYFQPKTYLKDDQAFYYADRSRIAKDMSDILPDYIPAKLNRKIKPNTKLVTIVAPQWLLEINDRKQFSVLVDKTQASLVMVNLPQKTKIVFARAYYPGWQAEIDGQKTKLDVTKDGLIAVTVPKGYHRVGVYLKNTPVRQLSLWLSLVSVIILLAVYQLITH